MSAPYPSQRSIRQLVHTARTHNPGHALAIMLMYCYGLRPTELRLIQGKHVNLGAGGIYITRARDGVGKWYPLIAAIGVPLRQHIIEYGLSADQTLFPFSPRQIARILKRYGASVTTYGLRRAAVGHLIEAGGSPTDIRGFLGLR